jgi:hypothetical protein
MYAYVFICPSSYFKYLYFIFGWKHDPYGKYKHESCFIKIGPYSTYAKKKKLHHIKF